MAAVEHGEEALQAQVREALLERGAEPGAATDLVAEALVSAELRGMSEFGLSLLRDADPVAGDLRWTVGPVDLESAVAVVDAEGVFAPIAMAEASLAAAAAAERLGLAMRVVRAPGGLGRLAPYLRAIADRGLIGFAAVGAPPMVAPHGASAAAVGTNPFAVALPTSTTPIVVDAATSALTKGRWSRLRADGGLLPPGTAVDAFGDVTVDPEAAVAILSRGGALGTVTAIVVEALSGGVAGMVGSSPRRRAATIIAIRGLDLEAPVREVGDDLRARLEAAGGHVPGSR